MRKKFDKNMLFLLIWETSENQFGRPKETVDKIFESFFLKICPCSVASLPCNVAGLVSTYSLYKQKYSPDNATAKTGMSKTMSLKNFLSHARQLMH